MDIETAKSTLQGIANLSDDQHVFEMVSECFSDLDCGDLEDDLIEVINAHINCKKLHPQTAAKTLAKMIPNMLNHLSWQTQSVRAAIESNAETIKHLEM